MDLELTNKVAVITGGGSGIGLGIATGLAREGVHLILAGRDIERLRVAARDISAQNYTRIVPVCCDVATASGAQALVDAALQEFGGADILINNAGRGSSETIQDASDDRWQAFWDLHVMAAVRLARGFVPQMRLRGGGVILHNASICAVQPLAHEPIYNVTKAALLMFSKNLANEVIRDNIRVNSVNPGLVLTDGWIEPTMQQAEINRTDWRVDLTAIAEGHAPIGRFGTVEEIADMFVFLCSQRASYCTGASYFVDGGWLRTV